MNVRNITFSLLVGIATVHAAAQTEVQGVIDRVDAQATAEAAKLKAGGITVGVVAGGKLAWTKSYGTGATRQSVYRIGSITKQFTALMLLQLVQSGKVHLSDPVEKYFPEVNKVQGRYAGAVPITLLQLATHTSGIDREPDDLPAYLKGSVAEWESVLIAALPKTKYAFEPGTRYHYSNVGYAILGAALSRAAGESYPAYVRKHILEPLGMTHTYFEPNDEMRPLLAKGHIVEQNGEINTAIPEREHLGRGYKVPNGALYTTVDDMARFVAFELGDGPESVLPKDVLGSSQRSFIRVTNPKFTQGYGLGCDVIRNGETLIYGHNGAVAGYVAAAYFSHAPDAGVIVLHNATGDEFNGTAIVVKAFQK
jgi:CubicO group peptidase (beta-lactamase class C family)